MKTLTLPSNIVIQARIFPTFTDILLRPPPGDRPHSPGMGAYILKLISDIYDAEKDKPDHSQLPNHHFIPRYH